MKIINLQQERIIFIILYRAPIIAIVVILLSIIFLFFALVQFSKSNNEKAAEIYNKWTLQEIETEDGQKTSKDLFNELLISYKKTGYTKLALLNQASVDAKKWI